MKTTLPPSSIDNVDLDALVGFDRWAALVACAVEFNEYEALHEMLAAAPADVARFALGLVRDFAAEVSR